jgi:hypothetical protein
MSEFVVNKNSSLTADIEEPPVEEVDEELEIPEGEQFEQETPEDIFHMKKQVSFEEAKRPVSDPIDIVIEAKRPVKKKRQLSEKQLAHLARMRAKSLELRKKKAAEKKRIAKEKAEQKLMKQQEKINKKYERKFNNKTVINKEIPIPKIPTIKSGANKGELQTFFANMHTFLDTVNKFNNIRGNNNAGNSNKVEPKRPVQQRKKTHIPQKKKRTYEPVTPMLQRGVSIENVNAGFNNPFGF